MVKVNLGAGTDIRKGYVNHDIAALDGIDVVHDLNHFPWPWPDGSVEEIIALDLLEHLDDLMASFEELHRILSPTGKAFIKVPYWNSSFFHMDPTHKRGFHEATFYFFDPSKLECQARPYYSKARFKVAHQAFIIMPFAPYFKLPFLGRIKIQSSLGRRVVGFLGNMFSNIILDLEVELLRLDTAKANDTK